MEKMTHHHQKYYKWDIYLNKINMYLLIMVRPDILEVVLQAYLTKKLILVTRSKKKKILNSKFKDCKAILNNQFKKKLKYLQLYILFT